MATVSTLLRIGPSDQGRTMTLQEFLEAEEEEGYRYELARGVLEVTEVPNDPHGVTVSNLYTGVARYHLEHPGFIYRYGGGNEFRFWLPGMVSGRNPDLGVVLRGAPKDFRGRTFPCAGRRGRVAGQHPSGLRREARGIPRLRPARILDRLTL